MLETVVKCVDAIHYHCADRCQRTVDMGGYRVCPLTFLCCGNWYCHGYTELVIHERLLSDGRAFHGRSLESH